MESTILGLYKRYHSGKENAITRVKFISSYWEAHFSDRQFRQVYSQLPICTCSKGGYYPIRREEILEYRDYLRKKAIPLFERWRRVQQAHPGLTDDMEQLGLEWSDDEGRTNQVTHDE